ncbi:hypothetical protein [Streptomyces sp. NPDC018584]|uniref:hypothetical protein n=1 Tax=unclassified Streptomyces TaxID=2593676 RepID=UPI0037ADFE83
MAEQHSGVDTRVREAIAHVCGRLERIRADLETYAAEGAAPLERLLADLRAGEDPAPALDALHEALLAAGDAVGVHGGAARGMTPLGVDPRPARRAGAALPDAPVLPVRLARRLRRAALRRQRPTPARGTAVAR